MCSGRSVALGDECGINTRCSFARAVPSHSFSIVCMYSKFEFTHVGAPINTIELLSETLGVTKQELEQTLALPESERYTPHTVKKKNGGDRTVNKVKNPLLKLIQQRIKNRVFANENVVQWPIYVYGSLATQSKCPSEFSKRDHIACASRHLNARGVLSIDIRDFFDNVDASHLEKVFVDFLKCSDSVGQALINLCCKDGVLVQGAATSSFLANLALYDVEASLASRLERKGLVYTRLVDDITVSSRKARYDFTFAKEIVFETLRSRGFMPNMDKVMERYEGSSPLTVHGLRVDYCQVRLPADEPKRIRAHVRALEVAAKGSYKYRTSYLYAREYARCLGRVYKLKRVGHSQHAPLLTRLMAVAPIPSKSEQEQCLMRLAAIQQLKQEGREASDDFRRKYYVLIERLSILKKSFPSLAKRISADLKGLRPPSLKGTK